MEKLLGYDKNTLTPDFALLGQEVLLIGVQES